MNAGIIIIGDEILIGQVVDINSSWISREMNKIGFRTETVITVGDDGKSISDAIDWCLDVADVVFMPARRRNSASGPDALPSIQAAGRSM